jgi:protein-L-isoaspartate(D-aspartate) O-methyltransferase
MERKQSLSQSCRARLQLVVALLMTSSTVFAQSRYDDLRDRMVSERVEAEGISNPLVLQALRSVPRHEFVPKNLRAQAYDDIALAIGHQQTISPPYIVAYMTETLDPQPEDRVLEIGTGSGYQAAVLAEIVKDVYTIEIVSPLSKQASKRLQELGYDNVHCLDGDGYKGWPEHAPFDKIIVTCSPESVPQPLIDQLKEGGRLIVPVGERYRQSFHLLKKEDGELVDERLVPTLFVPMTGDAEAQRRVHPDPLRPQIANAGFEDDENADGRVDGWHYQRLCSLCEDEPMEGKYCLRFENSTDGGHSQALQGAAIEGRQIGALQLTYWVRCENIRPGTEPFEQAGLMVHFYDGVRREVGSQLVGKWRGGFGWTQARSTILVPATAKEMIIRIGLNGAAGQLDFDDLQMATVKR